jgi:hypothetical protein
MYSQMWFCVITNMTGLVPPDWSYRSIDFDENFQNAGLVCSDLLYNRVRYRIPLG